MKIQDLIFILVFLSVLWRREARLAVLVGLFCLLLAIPLFKFWIFFTAERLTWYAAALFALGVLLQLRLKTSPRWSVSWWILLGGRGNKDKRRKK